MLSIDEINLLKGQNEGLKKQNAELQAENARLKLDAKKHRCKEAEAVNYNSYASTYPNFYASYKEALQEIKEIVKCKMRYDFISKPKKDFEQILQKINEVLDDNDIV